MNRINKEYKSIDERINILKSRGLLFKNETAAYNILLKHSYFDIINVSIPLSEVHAIRYRSPHNPLKKSIFFKS